jgi:hypothetical protein
MVPLAALWMRKPAEADVTSTEVGVEVQAPTSAGVSESPTQAGEDKATPRARWWSGSTTTHSFGG